MKPAVRIFLCTLLLVFSLPVIAAPAAPQKVFNLSKKLCGEFFPGDEFASCVVPAGWAVVKPRESLVFETDLGRCQVELMGDRHSDEAKRKILKSCSDQLRLTPIFNISQLSYTPQESGLREGESKPRKCLPVDMDGLIIHKNKKQISHNLYFHQGGHNYGCALEEGWKAQSLKIVNQYNIPVGDCEPGEAFERCCTRQGLSYVKDLTKELKPHCISNVKHPE